MEKELEERLRAEKATPSAASTSASSKTSPLGGLSRQMSKGPFIYDVRAVAGGERIHYYIIPLVTGEGVKISKKGCGHHM